MSRDIVTCLACGRQGPQNFSFMPYLSVVPPNVKFGWLCRWVWACKLRCRRKGVPYTF